MKDGDKLLTECRLASLEELANLTEQRAKELRLQLWLARGGATK